MTDDKPVRPIQRQFERLLTESRLLVLIPVVFLLVDAAGSFVYGTDILLRTVGGDMREPAHVGGRLGLFLVVMDTFLVGATLMIAAFGFYELFIVRRSPESGHYWLPGWLKVRDLEDLKARVVSMLILVAAITFVDRTVESTDEPAVLYLGLGIAVIIIALTAFLRFGRHATQAADLAAVAARLPGSGVGGSNESGAAQLDPGRPAGRPAADRLDASQPDGIQSGAGQPGAGRSGDVELEKAGHNVEPPDRREHNQDRHGQNGHRSGGRGQSGRGPGERNPGGRGPDERNPGGRGRGGPGRRRARVVALLGSSRREGIWDAGAVTDVTAIAGRAYIDLRDAVLPGDRVAIKAAAALGIVSVTVPPEMAVSDSGLALLGGRRICGATASPGHPGAPVLLLSGPCVLGLIRVRRRARDSSG